MNRRRPDDHGQLSLPIPSESLLSQREREYAEALRCLAPLRAYWADRWREGPPYYGEYGYWGAEATRLLQRWS